MSSIMDRVLLIILFLLTVRQLINSNFQIPSIKYNKKWSWLLYDSKEPTLCRHDYNLNKELDNVRAKSFSTVIEELLDLDARHVYYYKNGITHGRGNPRHGGVKSSYFIDTLEASYNEDDLRVMTKAICKLMDERGLYDDIDFVVCLKSGNQILANSILKSYPNIMHICIRDIDNVCRIIGDIDTAEEYSSKCENWAELLNKSKYENRKLTGVLVDCSLSDGDAFIAEINGFNKIIRKFNLNLNPITDAFALYGHKPLDDKRFERNNFKVTRYFDMDDNDEVRSKIYENRTYENSNKPCSDWQNSVREYLKSHGLIRYDS